MLVLIWSEEAIKIRVWTKARHHSVYRQTDIFYHLMKLIPIRRYESDLRYHPCRPEEQ